MTNEETICESCGMPMTKESDFGGGKTDNKYCFHCTDTEGNLVDWEEKVKRMTGFIVSRMGIAESEAIKMAVINLKSQPAWSGLQQSKV